MDARMNYTLGYVLGLAEGGATVEDAERFVLFKSAQAEPTQSRRGYERVYDKTRKMLRRETDRAQRGSRGIVFQGFKNPVTGKLRLPFSIGAKKSNTDISTMTPAQANLVALLTKHTRLRNHNDVARKVNKGHRDFEFLGDPTVFNGRAGRLTNRGMQDLRKAWKYVKGYDPDDFQLREFTNRLFGTQAGFGGSPFVLEAFHRREI